MRVPLFRNAATLCIMAVLSLLSGCGGSSLRWTRADFESYSSRQRAGHTFPLKFVGTEVNLKMGIIKEEFLDSRFSIDALPVRELKEYMERKYGVIIDTAEFEALRKKGNLKISVTENEKGEKIGVYNKDFINLDGTSVFAPGTFNPIFIGTSWLAANWSEYREPVSTMDFRYRVEKGRTDQMQVFIVLAPIGSYIAVYLRIRDGQPDEKGYYALKIAAAEEIPINFKARGGNTAGLADNIRQLPELLEKQKK